MQDNSGIVLAIARRRAKVLHAGKIIETIIERKFAKLIPGDHVRLENKKIVSVDKRKNQLMRSYNQRSKEIVANLDHLLLVTAPPPLFNLNVIDRTIALASVEEIPFSIILNKVDLEHQAILDTIQYYKSMGIKVLRAEAKNKGGCIEIFDFLENSSAKAIALSGISGVGKSSIVSQIFGDIDLRTNEVSEKTGQGRQTTSNVHGYDYQGSKVIYDVPGVQNFGLSHLEYENLRFYFSDFISHAKNCEYRSCLHLQEPNCGIKAAISSGALLSSRHENYQQIMSEIDFAKPY